jgi:hypothetical protein
MVNKLANPTKEVGIINFVITELLESKKNGNIAVHGYAIGMHNGFDGKTPTFTANRQGYEDGNLIELWLTAELLKDYEAQYGELTVFSEQKKADCKKNKEGKLIVEGLIKIDTSVFSARLEPYMRKGADDEMRPTGKHKTVFEFAINSVNMNDLA